MSGRLELGALLALCFFLPLYEAPKSIFWALYVVIWVVNRVRARDFGGRWDAWDNVFAAWLASGFVVAAFAGLHDSEWRGALDLLRYGSVGWLLRRSRYDARQVRLALLTLVVSTLAGLAWAHANLWRGATTTLQLNSVGHVNHTAIYLAIMLGLTWTWTLAYWRAWSRWLRAVALAVDVALVASLVVAASRAALAVAVLTMVVIAACRAGSARRALAGGLATAAVVALATALFGAPVLHKYERALEASDPLGSRHAIWRAAATTWERYPWFGIGMDNFSLITPERLERWRKETGKDYDARMYDIAPYRFSHGHSLFLTALAERGLVGLAPLLAMLLGWLRAVVHRPGPEDGAEFWLRWGAATGALCITAGVGVLNTTLHHEHGILAMLLLGLWLSKRPGR